jgi:hypothetical protein
MNTQEIHLLGLIGLRALAEYDPPEYKRSTDMSKRELERQIESILKKNDSLEGRGLYNDMKTVIDTTESPIELSFLLQQIYISSFRKAQYYSLQYSRQQSTERSRDLSDSYREPSYQPEKYLGVSHEEELIRLSSMLLLKYLPEYTQLFKQHFKDIEIDCVLVPQLPELPHIVIEAKAQIINKKQLETIVKQLKSVLSAFGKKTIGIIILENNSVEFNREILGKNVYLLFYNVRKNQFVGEELYSLVERIRGQATP